MIASRAKRFLLIIVTLLAAGALATSSFGADVSEKGTAPQKADPKPTRSG